MSLPPIAAKLMIDQATGRPFVVSGSNDTTPQPLALEGEGGGGGGGNIPAPLVTTGQPNEFTAQQDLINTQSVDSDTGNFRITGHGSGAAFTDWNAQRINDHIFSIGVNPGYGDSTFRQDTSKPSLTVSWETKYWLPGSRNIYAQEFGFRGFTTANVERRMMDSYLPYDGMEYSVGFYVHRFDLAHTLSRTGTVNGYQRIKHSFWPENQIFYNAIPISGTANGATTNSAGYAAGVEQVALAAAGTGALPLDCVFQFNGTGPYYAVQEAVNNVAAGGVLKFFPPLQSPLPASANTIVRVAVPAPSILFGSNGVPVVKQLNAAGNSFLDHWYYDATDGLTIPQGRFLTPSGVSAPILVRAKPSMQGSILAFQDSDGAFLGGPGGYASTTNGDGRGWFMANAKDETSGVEARYDLGGRRVSAAIMAEGGYGSSGAWLRMIASGTGASTAKLFLSTDNNTQSIDFVSWSPRVTRASFSGTLASFNIPVKLPSYTNLAALNAVITASTAGAGAMAHLQAATTPGGACIVVSDGSVWKVMVALGSATTVA